MLLTEKKPGVIIDRNTNRDGVIQKINEPDFKNPVMSRSISVLPELT
jgi:hypothetical protein